MKNKTLAQIHILKNQLGLSDDDYRTLLHDMFGALSSKELSQSQQKELASLFYKQLKPKSISNPSTFAQQSFIYSLSKQAPINDLSAFCSKIINRSISNVQELTKQEAIKVINSLKRYQKSAPVGSNK